MISFVVPIDPVPKGRPRFSTRGGFVRTPPETVRFEHDLCRAAAKYRPVKPLEGGLEITLLFQVRRPKRCKRLWPSVRPDLDNYVKATLDALHQFWDDDGQIIRIYARKRYGKIPLIKVEITPAVDRVEETVLDIAP